MKLRKLGVVGLVSALVVGLGGLTASSAAAVDDVQGVTDSVTYANKPVNGAFVYAYQANGELAGSTMTDAAGKYSISLPAGSYRVQVSNYLLSGPAEFLETYADQGAIAIENAQLLRSLERSNVELQRAYDRTIAGWANALDLKDEDTAGHSKRVTDMTVRLARRLGMTTDELVHVQRGALLHDIGKMGIPDSILLKRGPLTDEEFEVMRRHPVYAYELLGPIEFLRPALDIPYAHHERWDGTGYPRGLKGEEIPLAARIFAIVDVFDALTSDRPYRKAWTREEALAHIRRGVGTHFDPRVAEAFFELIETSGE